MRWKIENKDIVTMIDLDRVDAYEYVIIDEPGKKIHGNHMRVFINGSRIELNGEDADNLYNMLNRSNPDDIMD